MAKVYIEIEVQKQPNGETGVGTTLVGLPDDWDDQCGPVPEEWLVKQTPEVQFGIMAMNILDMAKPAICEKLSRFASLKVASLQ